MQTKYTLLCNLDNILKQKDITPYKLSKDTGERIGTIYKLVNNQDILISRLPASLLANICGYLEIGLGDMFTVVEADTNK